MPFISVLKNTRNSSGVSGVSGEHPLRAHTEVGVFPTSKLDGCCPNHVDVPFFFIMETGSSIAFCFVRYVNMIAFSVVVEGNCDLISKLIHDFFYQSLHSAAISDIFNSPRIKIFSSVESHLLRGQILVDHHQLCIPPSIAIKLPMLPCAIVCYRFMCFLVDFQIFEEFPAA